MAEDFTAKFSIDISDLKKSISEAQKQIKLANATFKAETAGMDKWSNNADGLSAKLKQLEKVLEAQKAILANYRKQLEDQQKAAKASGERADALRVKLQELADKGIEKTSDEYKQFEAELKKAVKEQQNSEKAAEGLTLKVLEQEAAVKSTERETRHYQEALDNLGSEEQQTGKDAEKAANSVEKLGDETEDASKKSEKASGGFNIMAGVLAGVVVAAIKEAIDGLKKLGKAAIDAWEDFDAGRDVMLRSTGATGDAAKELQASYSEVSKRIIADAEDIGGAIGEINTRFGINGEQLQDLSERYLQFAEITGTDVVSAIDDTQKALSAYGLSVDNAEGFLDVLAKTSQQTGVDTSTLTSGIISNATAFQEMGLSMEQAVAFMGQLEKSGTNSETVLNGMRKALKNSAKDGVSLNDALLDLQNAIEGNENSVDGLNAAYEVFGKSGDQIYGAIANGTLSFRDLAQAADYAGGTVEDTFNATKDASDGIQLALQGLKVQAAEVIDNFLQENGPEIEELINTLATEVLPTLIDVLKFVIQVISWVVGAFADAWTAIKDTWGAVTDFFSGLWDGIKETFSAVGQFFSDVFGNAWQAIKDKFKAWGQFWSDLWTKVKEKFSNIGSSIANAISDSIKRGINGVISMIENVINKGVRLINGAIKLINLIPGVNIGYVGEVSLPRLAQGGILRRGQMGLLEGSGAEAVVPLDQNKMWISRVAADMLNTLQKEAGAARVSMKTSNTTNNFTQIINAPKQPSRIELYRQTRNLLDYTKGAAS